jgi:hypothetical protein
MYNVYSSILSGTTLLSLSASILSCSHIQSKKRHTVFETKQKKRYQQQDQNMLFSVNSTIKDEVRLS